MKSFHGASFTMREEYEGRSPKYYLRSLDRIQNIKESSRQNLDYIHLLKANSTTISLEEALVTNLHNLNGERVGPVAESTHSPLIKTKVTSGVFVNLVVHVLAAGINGLRLVLLDANFAV